MQVYFYLGLDVQLIQLNQGQISSWNFKVRLKPDMPKAVTTINTPDLNYKSQRSYIRTLDMIDMKLMDNARYEVKQIEGHIRKNYTGTVWLTSLYNQAEAYNEGYRIMELYQKHKTKKEEKNLPKSFWRLYYPLTYEKTINMHSEKYGINSFFINSIIRQESLFNRHSISPSGARGLMQIMPETGKRLYTPTESQNFEPDELFRPNLNILLGTKYLNQLKENYRNNLIHILICYNAGPKPLERWKRRFRHIKDMDTFIESIPYPETRKYVKSVIRNYGIYQSLYSEDI